VRAPSTGNLITDIDLVENGVLWEEKSAVFATDIARWVSKHIIGKFHSYMRARQQLPVTRMPPSASDSPAGQPTPPWNRRSRTR
jgi:hypothetical protein